MLVIYVDDFKMAGPEDAVSEAWAFLRSGDDAIQMDDPSCIDSYLGCKHKVRPWARGEKSGRLIEYDMETSLKQCLQAYRDLSGVDELQVVSTPFIREDDTDNPARQPIAHCEGMICP